MNVFLQTEPPLNTPENREYLAEIMFESFNVPGLYIAVQVKTKLFLQFPTVLRGPVVEETVIPKALSGKIARCVLPFPTPSAYILTPLRFELKHCGERVLWFMFLCLHR